MLFDLNKPLEEKLVEYFEKDIAKMYVELKTKGVIFEDQFETLNTKVIEQNLSDIIKLLSKETNSNIYYDFSKIVNGYVFFDIQKVKSDEALKLLEKFFKVKYPEDYYYI